VPFYETYNFLANHPYDLIVLAGYMRILPPEVVKLDNIINIHPSLLPEYKGKDAIQRAYEAKEKIIGVTVHYVNENVDEGPIIEQVKVDVEENISLESLEEQIHSIEHKIYPMVIEHLLFQTPLITNTALLREGI
jgi:phosphoribosylglycinamide formyltransferase-1